MFVNALLLAAAVASPEQTVRNYLDALARLDHAAMVATLAGDYRSQFLDGEPRPFDPEAALRYRGFERGTDTTWGYEIVGVAGDVVTVVATEKNAFYDLIGSGTRTMAEAYTVANGKVRLLRTLFTTQQYGEYVPALEAFKAWMAAQPGAVSPGLFDGKVLTFDEQSARRMLPWLKRYAAERKAEPTPESDKTVRAYLDALVRLDHETMVALLADDATLEYSGHPAAPFDRTAMGNYRDFERGTDTTWRYEILGVSGDRVSARLEERNQFYDLIGSGRRTQVEVYVANGGRIRSRTAVLSVQERGTYDESLAAFKAWMATQPGATSPGLFDGKVLTFDKESAPRMLPWLKKYAANR